jgi:O-antigen/teichoic acid export membrane protein
MADRYLPNAIQNRSAHSSRHLINLLATGATQLLDAITPTVMVLMIGNLYGFESLGEYCVAVAIASISAILCGNGVANAVCFDIAKAQNDSEAQNASLMAGLTLVAAGYVVVTAILTTAAVLMDQRSSMLGLVFSLAPGYGLRSVAGILNGAFRGRREMHVAIMPMLLALMLVVGTTLPMLFNQRPLNQVALAWSACQACLPISLFLSLRHRGLATSFHGACQRLRHVAGSSWMMTLESVIFRAGIQLAIVILPLLIATREIGLYNAAAKPFQFLVIANDCVIQFFLPYLAAVPNGFRLEFMKRVQQFHKLAFFFTATTLVAGAVFAGSIASWLFGDNGPTVAPFMALLAFGYIIYYAPPYSSVFKTIGKSRLSVICGVSQTITILVALPLLAAPFGIWGVIYASCLAFAVYWSLEVWLFRAAGLVPVADIERYAALLLFNLGFGYALEASIGGAAAILIFIAASTMASVLVYWTPDELRLARVLVLGDHASRLAKRERFAAGQNLEPRRRVPS